MKKTALSALLVASLLGAACSSSSDTSSAAEGSTTSLPPASAARTIVVVQDNQIVSLDANGQNPLFLTKGQQDGEPSFRPDGQEIVFTRETESGSRLFRMRPDGSEQRQVTLDPSVSDVFDPTYSPDGQRILFSGHISHLDHDIYAMNADGTGLTRITTGPEFDRRPTFSPDGRQIAFQRDDSICVTGSEGGPVSTLSRGSFPFYAPDGRLLFCHESDLWATDEDTQPNRLTESAHLHEFDPVVGPDNTIFVLGSPTVLGKDGAAAERTGHLYTLPQGAGPNPPPRPPVLISSPHRYSGLAVSASTQVASGGGNYTANAPYARSFSPFTHGIGICYGHLSGRSGSTTADLDTLTKTDGFKSLHIYNLFSPGSLTPDPESKAVLDYAAAQSPKLEILLGTLNGEVTQNLASASGATAYVAALKPYLDTGVIKAIALANEPNDTGGAAINVSQWTTAAQNLRAALTAANYDTPITVCLKFVQINSYPPAQAHFEGDPSFSMEGYIRAVNAVNPQKPFVFVNFFPMFAVNDVTRQFPATQPWYPDFGLFRSATNPPRDGNLNPYLCLLDLQYNCMLIALKAVGLSNVQVYIGETGWPSADGSTHSSVANEAAYVNGLLNQWIRPQQLNGGTVPTFLFEGFDEPNKGPNATYGLRDSSGNLKAGISLPSFISQ